MKLTVASSPHIRGNFRTNRIMLDVVLALMPALVVGIGKYGVQALIVTAVSVLSAVATEYLYSLVMKKRNTVHLMIRIVSRYMWARGTISMVSFSYTWR